MSNGTVVVFGAGVKEEGKVHLRGDSAEIDVPIATIKKNLDSFVDALSELVPHAQGDGSGFHLESFDVAVGVDGRGRVGFLGTGAEVGANASLTLRFER